MATPLSPAQHRWRYRIFATTWLAYVGFYFCRKPFSVTKAMIGDEAHFPVTEKATQLGNIEMSYLAAYAIGQFLASQMGTRLGARKNVLLGMVLSIGVTIGMGVTLDYKALIGLSIANGLGQATGWSGNVGTMAGWFHKHERGTVMGMWSTCFTVGSIASGYAMTGILAWRGDAEWRWCYYLGALVLTIVWIQFYILQRNRPEDVGLPPVDDPVTPADESQTPEPAATGFMGLSPTAWINLLLVAGFYFFAKFVRYAVWGWAAYFLKENFKLSGSSASFYSTFFDVAGLPGVFLTGYLSDKYFGSRRAGISLVMMFGLLVATGLLSLFGDHSETTFAVLLAAVGFTLYGPDALLSGAGAIDIGGRNRATFATAVISGFGSIGPIVQAYVIPRLYDSSGGSLSPVFATIFGGAAAATVFCGILAWRNRNGTGV